MEDDDIVNKFADPESRNYAFNCLVRKYQQKIYWHVRKMVIDHDDANDLTQDIFVKIFQNLGTFRNDSKLFTWVYRVASNETLTFLAKKRRVFMMPLIDVEAQLSHLLDNGSHIEGDEIQVKLQKAILKLPEKQRLVFNMRYFDDLSYEDMAEVLNTSVGGLKASYHHAKNKIEEYLQDN